MNEVESKYRDPYMSLKSGSDIRGVGMAGVDGEEVNLNHPAAINIGGAFLEWLSKSTGKTKENLIVSIGRDPRLSGSNLKGGLIEGICGDGGRVMDCGLATTPAVFMSTVFREFQCDGGIMITASHLPYNRNGFKFFGSKGGLQSEDIEAILSGAAEKAEMAEKAEAGTATALCETETNEVDSHSSGVLDGSSLMIVYSRHLRNIILSAFGETKKPLTGMKIVVDAGNGSGGFFAQEVLAVLGADISGSQFLEPDGRFPNHMPNPEDRQAMESLSAKVIESGAHLGLIFDTDVDRFAAVDSRGKMIAGEGIIALASTMLAETHPGATVVTDSVTGRHLTAFLEQLGLKHLRYRRGYRNVINKAVEMEDAYLAIETSGHGAFKDNYFLDDGAYLATLSVIRACKLYREGRDISAAIEGMTKPMEIFSLRIKIVEEDFSDYGDMVIGEVVDYIKKCKEGWLAEPNYEGVRMEFEEGWFLLRKSLHEPIMPLNMESDREGLIEEMRMMLRNWLKKFRGLDISGL